MLWNHPMTVCICDGRQNLGWIQRFHSTNSKPSSNTMNLPPIKVVRSIREKSLALAEGSAISGNKLLDLSERLQIWPLLCLDDYLLKSWLNVLLPHCMLIDLPGCSGKFILRTLMVGQWKPWISHRNMDYRKGNTLVSSILWQVPHSSVYKGAQWYEEG